MDLNISGYVLYDTDNNLLVAIDSASGGYPYLVTDAFRAKVWVKKEDALNYNSHFPKNGYTVCKLNKVELSVE